MGEKNPTDSGRRNMIKHEDLFKAAIGACTDAIIVAGQDERVLLWGPGAERIFGYNQDEMIGKRFGEILIPEEYEYIHKTGFSQAVKKKRLKKGGEIIKAKGLRKDGTLFPLEHTVSMWLEDGVPYLVAILRDTTKEAQVEQKLRQMAKVFMENTDPILIEDLDGNVLDMNNETEKTYGWRRDDLIGKPAKTIVPPVRHGQMDDLFNRCKAGEIVRDIEGLHWNKYGDAHQVSLSLSLLRDETGNPTAVATTSKNLTEQKRIERQSLRALKELRQFIDTANAPIFGIDSEGLVNEWNQTTERITGFGKDEVMGKDLVEEFITDEYKAPVKKVLDKGLNGEETANFEFPLFAKDGGRVMVLLNATTRRNAEGQIVGVVGVGQDITELSEHREDLERLVETRTIELNTALKDTEHARERTDGILKSVADGLIVTDVYNKVILMNRAAEDLLGVRLTEVIDQPIDFAIKEKELRDRVKETLDKKTTGHQFDFEQAGNDPKHPRIMRARTSVVYDSEGKESGIVTIIQDVTYEREVERMKTDFLSIAAHELRTPMTSVLGYSELLLTKDNLSAEHKNEFIKYIHEESVTVTKLINDLLDISRIESGKEPPLNKEWYVIGDAIRQIAPYFIENSPKHRLEIVLPKEEHKLFADQGKMAQVIKNIIDNAVKYSPNGGVIRITGKLIGDNYGISVQDQGIGMTSEEAEKIFDRFFRTSTSQTSGIRGLGLGMSITKHIVELHKGMISAESELDKGTTVSFTIPVGADEDLAYQI